MDKQKIEDAATVTKSRLRKLHPRLLNASKTGDGLSAIRAEYEAARVRYLLLKDYASRGDVLQSEKHLQSIAETLDEITEDRFTCAVVTRWIETLPETYQQELTMFYKTADAQKNGLPQ